MKIFKKFLQISSVLGFVIMVHMILGQGLAGADVSSAYTYLNSMMDAGDTTLKFLPSYFIPSSAPSDQALMDVAYVYDNALALLCFIHQNSEDGRRRAGVLADAFVFAMSNDRFYQDNRLRNAYSSRQLIHRQTGKACLPGFWNSETRQWQEDKEQVSTHTGNMAWVVIALSQYFNATGGQSYKKAAISLGNWIYDHTYSEDGGYTGGFEGWEPQAEKIPWKSTEHNLDVYAGFIWLHIITGDRLWLQRALHAKRFVESMWSGDHFWIGTHGPSNTPDQAHAVLDVQALAALLLTGRDLALTWAKQNCYTEANGFKGFDFNTDKDGIWFEGTAQAALAFTATGEKEKAELFLKELKRVQAAGPDDHGKGIAAASNAHVSTGLGPFYINRPHIGATAWYIFAQKGFNPFTGKAYQK